KPLRYGLLLAIITILYGFSLGGIFGAFEDNIHDHLKGKAETVFESVYNSDINKMNSVLGKSWTYFKRAHLHANGIGTTALALILLLSFLEYNRKIKTITALALGLGAIGYSSFWMFAALKAPLLGSTDAAKEALKWLAVPSAFLCIAGLVMVLWIVIYGLVIKK
ncbi:MAG: hypothetical protein ABIJ12_09780, partial [bacterium]